MLPTKPRAIIVDLDGTLYDCEARRKTYLEDTQNLNFERFSAAAKLDKPHEWCAQLCQSMRNSGFRVLFVSGRQDSGTNRLDAHVWLRKHLNWDLQDYKLFMRNPKDNRRDDVIKLEIYREFIEPLYDIIFCVDDRKQVVDLWRNIGLTCLHCADGNF